MAALPNDPLFPYQWFLNNTGQSGGTAGADINVLPVWPDYTGRGVRVAIDDQGVQLDHPDLSANIDLRAGWDFVTNRPGGGPVFSDDNHGTTVAGLVAELANNGIGGSGVAPDATLLPYRMAPSKWAPVFARALEYGADVLSNSWSNFFAFAVNAANPEQASDFAVLDALGAQGRGGKGAVIVFAAGNDGTLGYDANLNSLLNSRYSITVGALDHNGARTPYTTPGADVLISAPGGADDQSRVRPGAGILTTDRTGPPGYNTLPSPEGDYDYGFWGTSAATPVVSGVVALMLQANANLGYRDVQEILASSARFTDPGSMSWVDAHAGGWNGGGQVFSRDYGFGAVDAHGAVRLAEIYPYLHSAPRGDANVQQVTASSGPVDLILLPGEARTFQVQLPSGIDLNHLDFTFQGSFPTASALTVSLTSPMNTTIDMIQTPKNPGLDSVAWPQAGFTLGTNAFWGEQSGGNWVVTVKLAAGGSSGMILSGTLMAYGDVTSTEKEFVYTDSFNAVIYRDLEARGETLRTTLEVQAGETAVIDAAAVSGAVSVDLPGGVARIGEQGIRIAPGTQVTKVFSGDGNDSLLGDANANTFLAGRGGNVLDGGGGVDTALYIGSRGNYTVAYDAAGQFTASSRKLGSSDVATHIEKAGFAEGTLYVQAATDAGLGTAALYNGLLLRAIDADGYRYWTNAAANGTSLESIGASFLASPEYAADAAQLDDTAFVQAVYQQMLHRSPEFGGLAYWARQLTDGALTRSDLVISISHSTEYVDTQLVGVFNVIDSLGNLWA